VEIYHFTCRKNIEGIMQDGIIRRGSVISKSGKGTERAVSLTNDFDPKGHGLPDGRVITKKQADDLRYYSESRGVLRSVDHTKYCLVLDVPIDDKNLIKAFTFYDDKKIIEALEIAAYYPHDKEISPEMVERAKSAFKKGPWVRKAGTWFYYVSDINLDAYKNICVRVFNADNNEWLEQSLSDFSDLLKNL